jgi:hypothetical protein
MPVDDLRKLIGQMEDLCESLHFALCWARTGGDEAGLKSYLDGALAQLFRIAEDLSAATSLVEREIMSLSPVA